MKKIITLLFLAASTVVYAQPKVLTQAMINTKTTIVASEAEVTNVEDMRTSDGGGEVRIIRSGGGGGETKNTTWLKNDLVKTFSESETSRTTVIRDNAKKKTTTIMEMMGRKTGVYATDEDQAEMRKRMDSMMKSRGQNVSFGTANTPATYSVVYVNESKKVAGFACKKALIIATRSEKSDTTTLWYNPDFKLQNLPSTGGTAAGFGGFGAASGSTGMDLLNGFPMQYERNMNRGRHMTVEVTKLVIDKDVADKEFEIPKDIEIKPAKDMQNGGGGPMIQMRVGG